MNQARKRTGTKKVLSMILVLVMLLSLLSMAAFTLPTAASSDGAASNDDFMRIFHLDCGRKYFSVSEIKGIIDQLAENHYTIRICSWRSETTVSASCWMKCRWAHTPAIR